MESFPPSALCEKSPVCFMASKRNTVLLINEPYADLLLEPFFILEVLCMTKQLILMIVHVLNIKPLPHIWHPDPADQHFPLDSSGLVMDYVLLLPCTVALQLLGCTHLRL